MKILHVPLKLISAINNKVLALSQGVALVAIVVMVCAILIQVFFRYILNNALPWPDELARFCMLWMTGLMAPVAYRHGAFVAIDMLPELLGKRSAALLSLFLLMLSLLVLVMGLKLGFKHVNSGFLFASSSLKLPLHLIGFDAIKVKLAYMYASLWIGLIMLTVINIELMLRNIISLFGGDPSQVAPLKPLNDNSTTDETGEEITAESRSIGRVS